MKFDYCGNKSNLSNLWIDHGISPCFFYTLFPCVLALTGLVAGTIQNYFYSKHGTRLDERRLTKSYFFYLQVAIAMVLGFEGLVRFALETWLIEGNSGYIHGYKLLTGLVAFLSWFNICRVIYCECRYNLPSIPTRGHGLILLFFLGTTFIMENLSFVSYYSSLWWFKERNSGNNIELGLFCLRYALTFLSFIMAIVAPATMTTHHLLVAINDDDDDSLIDVESGPNDGATPHSQSGFVRSTWKGMRRKFVLLWPFIWPTGNVKLQLFVLICFLALIGGRVVNLFSPIYYKKIVDSLAVHNKTANVEEFSNDLKTASGLQYRWDFIMIYVFLWFLQGGGFGSMGFLNNLRSFLWTWVQQYTTREVEVKLFNHVLGLSLKWHLGRKTGEVLRIVDRGTNSINNLLNYTIFSILPTIADITIAIIFFFATFSAWFAFIVLLTMIIYLASTIVVTEWRTKFRRNTNKLDNEIYARAVDSFINFETVKYYGAENFETEKYKESILKFQRAEWISNSSLNLLNSLQNLVITSGLMAGSLLCGWYVVDLKGLTAGDYVLFSTYVIQLYAPLNWFGTYYRVIQTSFIDMENMFDLLKETKDVKDDPKAIDLKIEEETIEFRDVSFHYRPDQPILKNVSFLLPAGKTFALVGPSGAGKSTIIRLLFRFYDIQSGTILIGGSDIKKVKQSSLRKSIGVVPQDTVLFNNDICYNIRYGRVTATDEEVIEAAKVADIHSKIEGFPEGYKTMVGERGLKLSGGEKQRVAIARTVLKSPRFVLLDEATSALDTQTERHIQSSLGKVCENRTTIIVAHRLSTIIHADCIIVIKDGRIVESGRHEELLMNSEGVYTSMWNQQLTNPDHDELAGKTSSEDKTTEPPSSTDLNLDDKLSQGRVHHR